MIAPVGPDAGRWRGWGFGFWAALLWVSVVVFCAVTASWLPVDPNRIDPSVGFRSPSWGHPCGTTRLGEDVFAICIHGSRVALLVALGAGGISLLIGTPLGLVAGYFRGPVDWVITRVLDATVAVPSLVVILALVLFVGQSLTTIVLVIGALSTPVFARVVRSATRSVSDRDYVVAARLSGASHGRILRREIGPNIAVPLASYVFLIAGIAMLLEGVLSFLGLGVPGDKASWGRLIQAGRDQLRDAWWWSMCPSAVFFFTILSLNVLQDRVQARWLGLPHGSTRTRTMESADAVVSASVPELIVRSTERGRSPMTQTERPVLELIDMCTYLRSPLGIVHAVDGVSLSVGAGEMVAIVGESGAGKTMLVKSILGIEPANAACTGRALLSGTDLRSLDAEARRQHRGRDIGIVLQDPTTSLDPVMRVGWQVAEPERVHCGLSRAEARTHAIELMGSVGISDPERRFRSYPHELSGGQLQRIAIALALSCGPRLLIADEPTSSLDVVVQRQILDLLDDLRRTRGLAILMITHDLAVATSRADRVAVMYAGRVVEAASAGSLARWSAMPYTAGLFGAAPRMSAPSHQPLMAIVGRPPAPGASRRGCAFAPRCASALDRCRAEAPALVADPVDATHLSACWHPLPAPTGDEPIVRRNPDVHDLVGPSG